MNDDALEKILINNSIIIYDGVCGFCDTSIQFVLNHKPSKKLKFASFQSKIGQRIMTKLHLKITLDSIVIIEERKAYKKSKAFFKILKHLDSIVKYGYYLHIIPSCISDFWYDIIAKNRYSLMGKLSQCRLISPSERDYFLTD